MTLPDRYRGGLPEERRGVPWGWIALGAVGALAVVVVVQTLLAIVLGLVKAAVVVVALAALAWVVIIGPPDLRRRK